MQLRFSLIIHILEHLKAVFINKYKSPSLERKSSDLSSSQVNESLLIYEFVNWGY